jgi:AhpD family alkylhydroperoxidase
MSETPRIQPDVGVVNWAISAISGRVAGTGPPNLFMTLGRHRRLFFGWLHFAGRLMPGGQLPRRETELVILRTAHLRDCQYEFEHHRHLAGKAGVTPQEIERLTNDLEGSQWSPRERALLGACDELHEKQDLSDETWQALAQHLDDRLIIEVVLLAAHYQMLATVIATLRVEPDRRP